MKNKYTKELLEEKVKISLNYSELCRNLGVTPKGASWFYIKKLVKNFNIDTSHFLGKSSYTGNRRKPEHRGKFTAENILVDTHTERIATRILKRLMLDKNIVYRCNNCGLDSWLNEKILLEIDHIDNNRLNCKIDNLQFLCPNCHSQKTYN